VSKWVSEAPYLLGAVVYNALDVLGGGAHESSRIFLGSEPDFHFSRIVHFDHFENSSFVHFARFEIPLKNKWELKK